MSQYCGICDRKVLGHSYFMKCDYCCKYFHVSCLTDVGKLDPVHVNRHENGWVCILCNETIFPFNKLIGDEFDEIIRENMNYNSCPLSVLLQDKIFNPFETNDHEFVTPLNDIDPDLQFCNELQTLKWIL